MSENNVSIPSLKVNKPVSFKQNPVPNDVATSFSATPNIDTGMITDTVTSAPLADKVMSMHEIPTEVLVPTVGGVWLGSNYLVDKLNKNLAKDYGETFYGKIAEKCDNFSTNNWLGKKIQAGVEWIDRSTENLAKNSKIVYTLKHHSTRPEWGFAKFPFYGLKGFLGMDLHSNVLGDCVGTIADESKIFGITYNKSLKLQKLLDIGYTEAEVEAFEKTLKGKNFHKKAIATLEKYLTKLGVADADIQAAKNAGSDERIIQRLKVLERNANITIRLPFNNSREYKEFLKIAQDNHEEVAQMLERAHAKNPNATLSHWKPYKVFGSRRLGKLVGTIAGRTSSWGEYQNKYKVSLGKGAKSFLGKFTTKSLAWLQEAATGRFAFGKLFALIAAVEVSKALIHTVKADGIKDKLKTGAERFTDLIATAIASTAAVIGMHKIGGFKYAGLKKYHYASANPDEVKVYRDAVEKFNKDVKSGLYTGDKAGYKTAKKAVQDLLHKDRIKNPITKVLHYVGRFVNMGNERLASYRGTNSLMNILRKCGNSNIIGVPLRIWLGASVLSGLVTKMIMGTEHSIFGKPKYSIEDEEKAGEEPEMVPPQDQTVAQQPQAQQPQVQQTNATPKNPNEFQSDTNLIKMAANGQLPKQQETTDTSNQTTVNSSNDEPVRTYIPNPDSMIPSDEIDMTEVDKALARADRTEEYCNNLLKSMNK